MNERIQQLAEQAMNTIPDDCPTVEQSLYLFQTKFAELIVRECMAVCEDSDSDCALEIGELFGIK
jgi:hypothetical protein